MITGPTVITAPGTYTLDRDIRASGAGTCLEVQAPNVVIEGNGYRIEGMGTGNTQGIRVENAQTVTIRDIHIERWDVGLLAKNAPGLVVEGVTSSDNSASGLLVSGDGTSTSFMDGAARAQIGILRTSL